MQISARQCFERAEIPPPDIEALRDLLRDLSRTEWPEGRSLDTLVLTQAAAFLEIGHLPEADRKLCLREPVPLALCKGNNRQKMKLVAAFLRPATLQLERILLRAGVRCYTGDWTEPEKVLAFLMRSCAGPSATRNSVPLRQLVNPAERWIKHKVGSRGLVLDVDGSVRRAFQEAGEGELLNELLVEQRARFDLLAEVACSAILRLPSQPATRLIREWEWLSTRRVDVAVIDRISRKAVMVVEWDGRTHDAEAQRENDRRRDAALVGSGVALLRISHRTAVNVGADIQRVSDRFVLMFFKKLLADVAQISQEHHSRDRLLADLRAKYPKATWAELLEQARESQFMEEWEREQECLWLGSIERVKQALGSDCAFEISQVDYQKSELRCSGVLVEGAARREVRLPTMVFSLSLPGTASAADQLVVECARYALIEAAITSVLDSRRGPAKVRTLGRGTVG